MFNRYHYPESAISIIERAFLVRRPHRCHHCWRRRRPRNAPQKPKCAGIFHRHAKLLLVASENMPPPANEVLILFREWVPTATSQSMPRLLAGWGQRVRGKRWESEPTKQIIFYWVIVGWVMPSRPCAQYSADGTEWNGIPLELRGDWLDMAWVHSTQSHNNLRDFGQYRLIAIEWLLDGRSFYCNRVKHCKTVHRVVELMRCSMQVTLWNGDDYVLLVELESSFIFSS